MNTLHKSIMMPTTLLIVTSLLLASYSTAFAKPRGPLHELDPEVREELQELREDGGREAVQERLEELGIEPPVKKDGDDKLERNPAVKEAIQSGDYESFLEAAGDSPIAEKIDQATFETLQEAQDLREAGDIEAAKELVAELDVKLPRARNERKKEMRDKQEKFVANLSDDDQSLLESAKELRAEGDKEAAQEIMKEIFENNGLEFKSKRQERRFLRKANRQLKRDQVAAEIEAEEEEEDSTE